MLAESFSPDRCFNFGEVAFSQPKLDGIRCIATAAGLFSRTGKPIKTAPHVVGALAPIFDEDPDLVVGGELYRHEFRSDFGAILSAVQRKGQPLEFHAFDLTFQGGSFVPFSRRHDMLSELLADLTAPYVLPVETVECATSEELDAAYARHLAAGYEGQVVRRDAPYFNGRTVDLMKRKEFLDAEFRVVSVNEGVVCLDEETGETLTLARTVTCSLPDGRTFGANFAASHEHAARILAERTRYVGQLATVRYQQLSPAGVPRFAVAVALHSGPRL